MKILVIPDCQVKPGVNLDHLEWCGKYIVDKKPDVVVQIGDFPDMESLSSYDVGKKSFEGRRYKKDIEASNEGMGKLMAPLIEHNEKAKKNHEKQYNPRKVMTRGNHDFRTERAINDDPKLEGLISYDDFGYEKWGWEVYPFLEPVVIGGIAFCHYFPSGQLGRPITSARMLLTKMHMSCVAGHQQGRDIAYGRRADGTQMLGLIAGSFYQHNEAYLNPQTNNHWRGIYVLHNVENGACDEMAVSLEYLRRKYGK
jgi:hypothetical protein